MKNLIEILYNYQSDEGDLSEPLYFEEEEQLKELSAKIIDSVGLQQYIEFESVLHIELQAYACRAYKQGFKDGIKVVRENT